MKKMSQTLRIFWYSMLILVAISIGIFLINLTQNFRIVQKSETNVSAVLERIQQISELNTVEMYFNEILDYRSSLMINDIELPFTEKSFIFIVKAKVQSGINLAALTEEDIQIEDKKITLTLDKAEITSKEVLEYRAYSEKDGFFNPVTSEDTLSTLNEFQLRLDKQARDSGILEKAEENAESVLNDFLSLIGYEEVVINFSE